MLSNMFPKKSCILLPSLTDGICLETSAPKKNKLFALLSGGEKMAVQTVNGDPHTLIQTTGHIIRCWISQQ